MPPVVKTDLARSPLLWLGVALLAALGAALLYSDGVAELARFSATYQRQIQHALSTALQDVKAGEGAPALWGLLAVCFGYGVVHTLGPGHGKAVVVAYFLDGSRPRGWLEGLLAGGWIAFTHTVAALLLALGLKLFASVSLLGAVREARSVEIVSYVLILLIGFWRLWAGLTGRLHEHPHEHPHGHPHGDHRQGHEHAHDHHGHAHAGGRDHAHPHPPAAAPRRTLSGWLLLTAAGIAPCAGALVIILLSAAMGVLWAGVLGVIAIALGMAITLGAIGIASMLAHRLIIAEGRAQGIGRITAIVASLIVIGTAGTLLLGALHNSLR